MFKSKREKRGAAPALHQIQLWPVAEDEIFFRLPASLTQTQRCCCRRESCLFASPSRCPPGTRPRLAARPSPRLREGSALLLATTARPRLPGCRPRCAACRRSCCMPAAGRPLLLLVC